MSAYSLRPVAPSDDALLLALYASTRSDEMAMLPWPHEQKAQFLHMQFRAQTEHYAAHYPHARHEIILHDTAPVGRLWVDRQDDTIHILDLTILPQHRGAGIGSSVLRDLQAEAAASGTTLDIYVESFNRSVGLFRRLGFGEAAAGEVHVLFTWKREGE